MKQHFVKARLMLDELRNSIDGPLSQTNDVPTAHEIHDHLDNAENSLNEAESWHTQNQGTAASTKFGEAVQSMTHAAKTFDKFGVSAPSIADRILGGNAAENLHQDYLEDINEGRKNGSKY
jgi:predicted GNAT family acetyltransferase